MAIVSMKKLLESGVHFGHRTHKWNPAMKPYIFTERNNIHIIDLQQTVVGLQEAHNLITDIVAEGGSVLFVGTKRQGQETIQDEATRCGMPYVNKRWLGGMLTNWRTIRLRINELERLERMRDEGEFERLTKKEGLLLHRQIDRLEMLLGGIRSMNDVPEILFAVDIQREETAVHEANLLEIPVVALVDTNCNPDTVDYIIPSNDDAIRAIKLLVGKIADAVLEGKAMRKDVEEPSPEELRKAELDEIQLSDEELLGEATLAKISASETKTEKETEEKTEEEAEEEADTEVEETVEKADQEEAQEADAEEAEETAEEEAQEVDEEEVEEVAEEEAQEASEEKTSQSDEAEDEEDTSVEDKDDDQDEGEE